MRKTILTAILTFSFNCFAESEILYLVCNSEAVQTKTGFKKFKGRLYLDKDSGKDLFNLEVLYSVKGSDYILLEKSVVEVDRVRGIVEYSSISDQAIKLQYQDRGRSTMVGVLGVSVGTSYSNFVKVKCTIQD